jgi:hypothetical protein
MLPTVQRIIDKLLSGRYLLTVAGAIAFLYCVWKKELEGAAISAILVSIFQSYFNRSDRSNEPTKSKSEPPKPS